MIESSVVSESSLGGDLCLSGSEAGVLGEVVEGQPGQRSSTGGGDAGLTTQTTSSSLKSRLH
jgi:hypothetical protein